MKIGCILLDFSLYFYLNKYQYLILYFRLSFIFLDSLFHIYIYISYLYLFMNIQIFFEIWIIFVWKNLNKINNSMNVSLLFNFMINLLLHPHLHIEIFTKHNIGSVLIPNHT